MDMDKQERAREWRATLRSRPPPPYSEDSWALFLDYTRLWRLCPDLHRRALHWLLCACGGSLARAIDNVLLAKRLRQRCGAWRCAAGRAPYAYPRRPSAPAAAYPRRSNGSSSNSTASSSELQVTSGEQAASAPPIAQLEEGDLERLLGPTSSASDAATAEAAAWPYHEVLLNDVKSMDQEDIKTIIDLTKDESVENMNRQPMSMRESAGSSCDFFNDGSYMDKSVTCYRT